jgi:hypothetical protein
MLFYNKHWQNYQMKWRWNTTVFSPLKALWWFIWPLVSEITLVPKNADTLFKIKNKTTSTLQLLTGEVQLGTLEFKMVYPASKKRKKKKFWCLFKKDPPPKNQKKGLRRFCLCLINKILNLVTHMVLDNLAFKIDDNGNKTNINFQKNYV